MAMAAASSSPLYGSALLMRCRGAAKSRGGVGAGSVPRAAAWRPPPGRGALLLHRAATPILAYGIGRAGMSAGRRRCRSGDGAGSEDQGHQALLGEILGRSDIELGGVADSLAPRLTTPFFIWLEKLQEDREGTEEGKKLEGLLQLLVGISLASTVAEEGIPDPPPSPPSSAAGEGFQEALVLMQGEGALTLSKEGAAKALAMADDFGRDLKDQRRSSAAAVMGRVQVESPDMVPAAAGVDARILEVLLSMPPDSWADALVDACTPPGEVAGGEGGGDEDGGGEEMLFSTPLRLLQAVESEMRRLEGREEGEGGVRRGLPLPGMPAMLEGDSSSDGERYASLGELRKQVAGMAYE